MIGTGIVALVLATIEHKRSLQALRKEYGDHVVPKSLALAMAGPTAVLGFAGLLLVLFRQ